MQFTKRAHDVIQGPIHPFIQKNGPRFQSAGKHWSVHPDDVIRQQADNTQLFDGSILAVSRQENQYRYGKNSYISKVNKNFRPPLIDPEYDLVPLCRIPRPRTQIRINPESMAKAQNAHETDVSSFIDTRVLKGAVRPSFTINMPIQNQENKYPELKFNKPQVAGYTAINTPTKAENIRCDFDLPDINPRVYANSSVNTPFKINQTSPFENLELTFNKPNVEAMAGINTPFQINQSPIEDMVLDYNGPQISAHSGVSSRNISKLENIDYVLDYNCPQVSAISGIETNISFMNEMPEKELNYNRPQTSLRSNPGIKISNTTEKTDIRIQNPITLNYQTTKNYGISSRNENQNPHLRDKLIYDKSFKPTCTIPSFDRNGGTIKLKPKK